MRRAENVRVFCNVWYSVDTESVRTYAVYKFSLEIAMNLTISVDKKIVERARKVAEAMHKSLNQLVREYLEQVAGTDEAERDCQELRRLSAQGQGRSRGWKFNREELHERS